MTCQPLHTQASPRLEGRAPRHRHPPPPPCARTHARAHLDVVRAAQVFGPLFLSRLATCFCVVALGFSKPSTKGHSQRSPAPHHRHNRPPAVCPPARRPHTHTWIGRGARWCRYRGGCQMHCSSLSVRVAVWGESETGSFERERVGWGGGQGLRRGHVLVCGPPAAHRRRRRAWVASCRAPSPLRWQDRPPPIPPDRACLAHGHYCAARCSASVPRT